MIIRDYAGEIPGIMKVFITFFLFVASTTYADDFCYQDSVAACRSTTNNNLLSKSPNCNAKYGAIDALQGSLQKYANHFIDESFNFLLMSTYYGNYVKNRPGFEKLYRSLSDSLWNDGIELIKYIDSRGGSMKFTNSAAELSNDTVSADDKPKPAPNWELNELQSLAKALDIEKSLTTEAFEIDLEAENHKEKYFDPEIAFHIEEEFLIKQRQIIRKLAGYTHDLGELLNTKDASLAVYLFDEILQNEKY